MTQTRPSPQASRIGEPMPLGIRTRPGYTRRSQRITTLCFQVRNGWTRSQGSPAARAVVEAVQASKYARMVRLAARSGLLNAPL